MFIFFLFISISTFMICMSITIMVKSGLHSKKRTMFYLHPPNPLDSKSYNELLSKINSQLLRKYDSYKNCTENGLLKCGEKYEGYKLTGENKLPPNDNITFPIETDILVDSTAKCYKTELVISLMTSPDAFIERHSYRKSYKLLPRNYPVFFFMGYSKYKTINTFILEESKEFNDIIQFDVEGSYYKLSVIMISIIRWLKSHCSNYKYVIHHQTDIFINIPYFFEHIDNSTITEVCPLIGLIRYGYPPVRDINSIYKKWYVPKSVYPFSVYPNFPSAACIMFTEKIINMMDYATYHYNIILPMDDVFIGLLLNYTGLTDSQCNYEDKIISNYPHHPINSLKELRDDKLWIHSLTPGSIYYLSKTIY